ncbi:MAG TPA: LAGLIDADG family homing endonuclease [Nitrososphaerales archaeon]|nr:LAGLIDADG family homing endonuclease [Nitrososphaerales archaeon]
MTEPIFEASPLVKERVIRGYFDADGYPNFSKARRQVSVKATSVNKLGVESMKTLLETIGYGPGVYRRYNDAEVWELCIGRRDEVVRFHNRIGFSIHRKQEKLGKMMTWNEPPTK